MKKTFILLIFISFNCFGQLKSISIHHKITKKEIRQDSINQYCIETFNFTEKQRLKFYPFNVAKNIKLVSFQAQESVSNLKSKSNFTKIKILNELEINQLTQVLFNYKYKGKIFSSVDVKCYEPRNAILFLDKNGQVFEYIELCFACSRFKLSSTKVKTGDFCEGKYELLKNLFKKFELPTE